MFPGKNPFYFHDFLLKLTRKVLIRRAFFFVFLIFGEKKRFFCLAGKGHVDFRRSRNFGAQRSAHGAQRTALSAWRSARSECGFRSISEKEKISSKHFFLWKIRI